MFTFEEFFNKKKIDLLQFQVAEPALFAEFSKHYPLMGEKSFDHAKKYWFNQLRRTYPLPEIVKPHPVLADAISNLSVQSIAVAAAQNLDAGLEKPKFKEDELVELSEGNIPLSDISLAEAEQSILQSELETTKPAFKPRFNPKNIPKADNIQEENNLALPATENQPFEAPKPAFKPRFNMQNIKKESVKTVSDSAEPTAETAPQILQVKPEDTLPETVVASNINFEITVEPVKENEIKSVVEAVKPAYKPRFKMQQTPKPVAEQDVEAKEDPQKPETAETKQPYKPRFQMKNLNKPAQPEE